MANDFSSGHPCTQGLIHCWHPTVGGYIDRGRARAGVGFIGGYLVRLIARTVTPSSNGVLVPMRYS